MKTFSFIPIVLLGVFLLALFQSNAPSHEPHLHPSEWDENLVGMWAEYGRNECPTAIVEVLQKDSVIYTFSGKPVVIRGRILWLSDSLFTIYGTSYPLPITRKVEGQKEDEIIISSSIGNFTWKRIKI